MTAASTAEETTPERPATRPAPGKYMPGLDVVRGLAIAAVVFYHGLAPFATQMQSRLSAMQFGVLHFFEFGARGVNLFFVLSGFLITGILLDTRHNPSFYKPFYLRRVLRIVPVYLLMIVVLKTSGFITWRFVAVSLLYLCNLSGLLHAAPEYGSFWSLSVEEQFYLVWPVIVRHLRTRALFLLSLAIVILTPVLRFGLLYGPAALSDIHYKTWAVGDFFAAGALLAMLVRSARFRPTLRPLAIACSLSGATLVVLTNLLPELTRGPLANAQRAFYLSPWMLLCSGIVLAAYLTPQIAALPVSRPLIFLGYISYGLYIVHSFIFVLGDRLWPIEQGSATGATLVGLALLRFVLASAVCIGIAWLSRSTFEQFFLRLKPRQPKVVENLTVA